MGGIWNPTGANMGNATGVIRIDTSDVQRAGTVTKVTAQQMTEAFAKVDSSAKKTSRGFVSLASDVQKVRGEVVALSAGAGILTGLGLQVASSLETAAIQFAGLTGSIESANKLMVDLRKKSLAAGIPFADMQKAAKQLLPTLEGDVNELDTYVRLAQRVATLNPAEGMAGAAFAINEALSSGGTDLVSLSERFQVKRFALREELKRADGDFAVALDRTLNKMGITQQVADEMGQTFQASFARAKDSAGQLLGTGFTPLLNALTPILDQTTQWMVNLQDTNPELLTMAAGVTAIVAAGGPLLLMLSQVITSLQTIKTLSIAGSLGKAGAVGLSAAAGVGIGVAGAQAIGRATGNEQLAQSNLDTLWKIIRTYTLVIFDTISKVQIEIGIFIGSAVRSAIGQFVSVIGEAALILANLISRVFPGQGAEQAKTAQSLIEFGKAIQLTEGQINDLRASFEKQRLETAQGLLKALFPEVGAGTAEETISGGGTIDTPSLGGFSPEQIEAFADFQQDMKGLEEQGAEQRLRINEQYQEAVANIEERLADMRKRIADAEREAAEGEAKAEDDFQLRRQQTIEDAQEDSIRALEDFNREDARRNKEHKRNLWEAASRFDALGIIREMHSFSEKKSQANEDFQVSQARRAEELNERLAQEGEAHIREMGELRENNRRKLNELRQQYAEEFRAAQEKLIRLRDAHNRELSDLATKLTRERDMRQRAFIEQFNSLAGSLNNQIQIARQGQAQMQGELRNWWIGMRNDMNTILNSGGGGGGTPGSDPGGGGSGGHGPGIFPMSAGGPIPTDRLVWAHADEEMLKPDVARQIRSAMGGSINQPALAAAMSGGRTGGMSVGSITVGPIYGAPGQSAEDIGQVVEERLLSIFDRYNKS